MPKAPDYLVELSREKRREATPAEAALWKLISGRRLGGFKFRRQHRLDRYIADFYCPEKKLVVELDGSHHLEPDVASYDEERTNYLSGAGIRVLRFENKVVLEHPTEVLRQILDILKSR